MPLYKKQDINNNNDYPIDIGIIDSERTDSGGTILTINIQCSPHALINRGVNSLELYTEDSSPSSSKQRSPRELISKIYKTSKSRFKSVSTIIDIKEYISSEDIQLSSEGNLIAEDKVELKKVYKKSKLNDLPPPLSITGGNFLSDNLDLISTNKDENLISRKRRGRVQAPLPTVFDNVTKQASDNKPEIQEIKKVTTKKLMSKNISLTIPNGSRSQNIQVVAQLKDKDNLVLCKFPIGLSEKPLTENSEYINDYDKDRSGLDVFYRLHKDPSLFSAKLSLAKGIQRTHTLLTINNIPWPINGMHVYRKDVRTPGSVYNLIDKPNWGVPEPSVNLKAQSFNYPNVVGEGALFKLIPTIDSKPIYGITRSEVLQNPKFTNYSNIVLSQREDKIKIDLYRVSKKYAGFTINRRNINNLADFQSFKVINTGEPTTYLDNPPAQKGNYMYEAIGFDEYNIDDDHAVNAYINFYPKATRYSYELVRANGSASNIGESITHTIVGELNVPSMWIPEKEGTEIQELTPKIIQNINDRKTIVKIHVVRRNTFGQQEDLGVYCINKFISDIPSEIIEGTNNIIFTLNINDAFARTAKASTLSKEFDYEYEIRPLIYPIGNELAFLPEKPKIEFKTSEDKVSYKYDPFVYDNPSNYEYSVLGDIKFPKRSRLYEDAKIHEAFYVNIKKVTKDINRHPSTWIKTILFNTSIGNYINPVMKKKEKYIQLDIQLGEVPHISITKIEIWAAATSTGIQELISVITPFNNLITVYDFDSYSKDTDGIIYTLRIFDIEYKEISSDIKSTIKI